MIRLASSLLVCMPLLCLAASPASQPATQPTTQPVSHVGRIEYRFLSECSGLVASRRHPAVYWAHNDSGHRPTLYALTREGKLLNEFPLDLRADDWEDIAIDDAGQLYVADIGNNGALRKHLRIYRLDEPDPAAPANPKRLPPTAQWRLSFPDNSFDCEAFFVYQDHGYLISKLLTGFRAVLYRFPLDPAKENVTLEKVTTLPIRSPVTAADLSPDGNRLAVLTYTGLNLFPINGDPASAGRINPRYTRYLHPGIEACCFTNDGVLVASESRDLFLFRPDPQPLNPNPEP